ncbi:hypothetical protein MYAM1_002133 [Malassezia yamatoensis]|uniref:Uncharacterized protein n=1 Tax=Malassezia yamatoensis TaxID=253288 RepID=A0AAJ6CH06_9BASI|nr:hypothetical protein MYAM1_002133 [Malassezia yamatoensis]
MITQEVDAETRAIILKLGCTVKEVTYWDPGVGTEAMAFARFKNVWTKLRVMELTEYERVILMDTDMLVRRNMDELMDWPLDTRNGPVIAAGSACTCNPNRIPTYPADWVPSNCPFTRQTAPKCHDQGVILNQDSPPSHHLLNGGLVVIEPSQDQVDALTHFIQTKPQKIASYRFPDQDLLSELYHGQYIPLPWKYNALKKLPHCHPQVWCDDEVRNVHYILDKPWITGWPGDPTQDEDARLHQWWWDAYHALQSRPEQIGLSVSEWRTHVDVHVNDAPRKPTNDAC